MCWRCALERLCHRVADLIKGTKWGITEGWTIEGPNTSKNTAPPLLLDPAVQPTVNEPGDAADSLPDACEHETTPSVWELVVVHPDTLVKAAVPEAPSATPYTRLPDLVVVIDVLHVVLLLTLRDAVAPLCEDTAPVTTRTSW